MIPEEQEVELLRQDLVDVMRRMRKIRVHAWAEQVIYTEYQALDQISRYVQEHPLEPGIKVSTLACDLHIAASAASRLLGTMEGKKLIARSVDTKDRRNTFVSLTPLGKELLSRASRKMDELNLRIIRRMGAEECRSLIELWNKLASIMEDEVSAIMEKRRQETEGHS